MAFNFFNDNSNVNISNNNKNAQSSNYKNIGEEFCKLYYSRLSKDGFNSVLDLFAPNALCTFENEEYRSAYSFLIKLAKMGALKFAYAKVAANSQPLNDSILITASGSLFPISFMGQKGKQTLFSETFVLSNNGSQYYVTNYILRLN